MIAHQERARRQLDNTCRLRTNPYLAIHGQQTIDEVAGHGVLVARAIPVFKGTIVLVHDIQPS